MTTKKTTTKKITPEIKIKLERINNQTILNIQIPEKMEKFFKSISSNEKRMSERWAHKNQKGAEFYVINSAYNLTEKKITSKIATYSLQTFNDYGDGLYRDNAINLAPLRTVNASKGIRIFNHSNENWNLENIDLENYIRKLADFSKKLWESVIEKQQIKAIISFEL